MSNNQLPENSTRLKPLIILIAVPAIGYLGMMIWAGHAEVAAAVAMVGFGGLLVALGLSANNLFLRYLRWHRYLHSVHRGLPALRSFSIYLSGFALTASPGKVGELIRSVFLKKLGVRYADSVAVFFSDRLSDLMAVLVLVAVGLWKYDVGRLALLVVGFVGVTVLILTRAPTFASALVAWSENRSHPRIKQLLLAAPRLIRSVHQCITGYNLLLGFALSIMAWASQGMALYYLATFMGAHITMTEAIFVHSLSILAGALSLLPGGIGATDLTMAGMLMLYQLDAPQAVACAILLRLITLWFAIALGVIALKHINTPGAPRVDLEPD